MSPEIANALTLPLAEGLKEFAPPVAILSEAIFDLAAPPILANAPPTNNVVPEIANALTEPSAFGFQPEAAPVEALTCAILFFITEPFTNVKSPPKYTLVPSENTVLTMLFAFGLNGSKFPETASTAAMLLRALAPTLQKVPPANIFVPLKANESTLYTDPFKPIIFGFQVLATPVPDTKEANLLLAAPPIFEKSPPTIRLPFNTPTV